MKSKLMQDVSWRKNEKLEAKLEFMKANYDLMTKKNERKMKEIELKKQDDITYFPFNHGEAIEKQRKQIAENKKEELLKNYFKHA